ncbi:MAG: LLM class flavin-dependent oxidoreductase [Chloroflexi bacterium]|nr:LLM class flavin-dependent oxidoreductase [Chloroflexota bacterium]
MSLPLSVLDLSPIPVNGDGSQALRNTIDLAQHAEDLGYRRFWVAEHHNMRGQAGVAPEVLIGVIAQRTRQIRVGSGGVLAPNYAALKVAELFRTLEALTPGRIDAGIGRAPNMDSRTVLALRGAAGDPNAADDIARIIAEIEGFAEVAPTPFPADHPLHRVIASPEGVTFPPVYLLGSGQLSARIAAERGRGFASAYFFSPDESEAAIRAYKAQFRPSPHFAHPHAILTVGVICAETETLAADLAHAAQFTALRRLNEVPGSHQFSTVADACSYRFTPEDEAKLRRFRPICGTPARMHAELTQLAAQLGADELMLTTAIGDHALRRRSYELLAEVFGLVELGATR